MEQDTCAVDGCRREVRARGYCNAHLIRLRRFGDVRADKPVRHIRHRPRRDARERFFAKVKTTASGCWEWQGWCNPGGYGQFCPAGRQRVMAHRFSYELFVGQIPAELQLDHLCRNPACVNPEHLEPVTAKENMRRSRPFRLWEKCSRGHEFTPENTWYGKDGRRLCRACDRDRHRVYNGWAGGLPFGERTHCPQGHPYDEENTYKAPRGGRVCRICARESSRRYRERQMPKTK